MKIVNLNVYSLFDLFVGILMLHTVSPLPELFASIHAYFLISKGGITLLPINLQGLIPLLVFGAAADVISAAIILTGQLPILTGYKEIIAGVLFIKGLWSLLGFMG